MHGVSELLLGATPDAVTYGSQDFGFWHAATTRAPGESSLAFIHHIIIRFDPALHRGNPKCAHGPGPLALQLPVRAGPP
jgi:hypothetical protein